MTQAQTVLHCIAQEFYRAQSDNVEISERGRSALETLARDFLPSGSGFDSGTKLDLDASRSNRLVFDTSFHHMNDWGSYDGWTEHTVTVQPDFIHGFTMSVSGRNRNDIKDYIADVFRNALDVRLALTFDAESRTFTYCVAVAPEEAAR